MSSDQWWDKEAHDWDFGNLCGFLFVVGLIVLFAVCIAWSVWTVV